MKERIKRLSGILEIIILFSLALGGLFLGWFSPTQAGAIGAAGALCIGLVKGHLKWDSFVSACKESVRTSCMVIFIIAGATIFGHFMAVTRIPFLLADFVGTLPFSPLFILIIIMLIYFIGGFFMDSMALIVLTVPIFYPVVVRLGFDPIWFGVIIVLLGEMGVLTPPVGVNVFVIKSIAQDVPLEKIFKGIIPFLIALIVTAAIIVLIPELATFLPRYLVY